MMVITGDVGTNTITTITSAASGMILTLLIDGNVSLTDDAGHGADTLQLGGNFNGDGESIIQLMYDGTSWYEISRSAN